MKPQTRLHALMALAFLVSPAPALASDFSGLYYALLGFGLGVAALVAGGVWQYRRAGRRSARGDVIAAVMLGLACAPAGLVTGLEGMTFEIMPAWMWLWISGLEGGSLLDLAGPVASIGGVALLAYVLFRRSRKTPRKRA